MDARAYHRIDRAARELMRQVERLDDDDQAELAPALDYLTEAVTDLYAAITVALNARATLRETLS
jgi:hypothetical protein